jgi:hypothetical protein
MRRNIILLLALAAGIPLEGQTTSDCEPVIIQRLDSVVSYVRNTGTGVYTPSDVFIYYFDGQDKYPLIDRLSLPSRTPVNRQNYFYDSEGKKTHYILQNWNGTVFEDRSRTDYSYRPDGYLDQEVFSDYSGGGWVPYQQHWYNYDESLTVLTYLRQMMYSPGVWTDYSYKNYIYDDYGHLVERNEQRLSDGVVFWAELFTYDDQGRTATRTRQTLRYFPATGTWGLVNLNRQTYSYDIYGDLSGYLTDTWTNDEWVLTGKSEYYRSLLLYKYVPVCYNGVTKIVTVKVAIRLLAVGGLLGSCECLFPDGMNAETKSPEQTTAMKPEAVSVTLYPNPASSEIRITLDRAEALYNDVSIYNQSGSLMTRSVIGGPDLTINIANLKPGTYYMVLTGTGGQYMTTFIKKQ